MQIELNNRLDLLTYNTLGQLFAHLEQDGFFDIERMREIKRQYEAQKIVLLSGNVFK